MSSSSSSYNSNSPSNFNSMFQPIKQAKIINHPNNSSQKQPLTRLPVFDFADPYLSSRVELKKMPLNKKRSSTYDSKKTRSNYENNFSSPNGI